MLSINAQQDMEVIGEAGSVNEAITIAREMHPDFITLDLSLPDRSGIELVHEIKAQFPEIKMLVLTIHDDENYLHKVMREGANGYLLKNIADDELVNAIKAIDRGELALAPVLTKKILQRYVINHFNCQGIYRQTNF